MAIEKRQSPKWRTNSRQERLPASHRGRSRILSDQRRSSATRRRPRRPRRPRLMRYPDRMGLSFGGDSLKRRTNLEVNPERLISSGEPPEGKVLEIWRNGCSRARALPPLEALFSAGRRNEWELLRAEARRVSSDLL